MKTILIKSIILIKLISHQKFWSIPGSKKTWNFIFVISSWTSRIFFLSKFCFFFARDCAICVFPRQIKTIGSRLGGKLEFSYGGARTYGSLALPLRLEIFTSTSLTPQKKILSFCFSEKLKNCFSAWARPINIKRECEGCVISQLEMQVQTPPGYTLRWTPEFWNYEHEILKIYF